MAKKKGFALRIDEEMIAAVEKWAADEFRSTNGQIEFLLYQALRDAGRLPKKKEDS
jgi:hypothetical protein